MLAFSSCKSNQIKAKKETNLKVYFPAAPYPTEGLIIPVTVVQKAKTEDRTLYVVKVITDNNTEIVYDMVPHWWLCLVADYMNKTESAVQALTVE